MHFVSAMVSFPEVPKLSPRAELLLFALASASCPQFQVDFDADHFAPLMGWTPQTVHRVFREIGYAGLLTSVAEVQGRWQIHPRVQGWIWDLATHDIPVAHPPDTVQEAAQLLLLVRIYGA